MRINCAVHEGDYNLLKHLIESGANPNNTDYDGRSPLVMNFIMRSKKGNEKT